MLYDDDIRLIDGGNLFTLYKRINLIVTKVLGHTRMMAINGHFGPNTACGNLDLDLQQANYLPSLKF